MIYNKKTSMKKFDKVIILHGCPPNKDTVTPIKDRWMNWLANKLIEKGYDAVAPDFPRAWEAKYKDWRQVFEKYPITKNSLLVGHSCGGAFLVRWLLENKKKVKKLILVAPAKVPEGFDDKRRDMYEFKIPKDASNIAEEIVIFTSNDFPHHLKALEQYKRSLKPKVIKLENKFHFLYFQMKTNEFPEILKEIL